MPADHDRARAVVERSFTRDAACHAGVPAVASDGASAAELRRYATLIGRCFMPLMKFERTR